MYKLPVRLRQTLAIFAVVALQACTITNDATKIDTLTSNSEQSTVVLMPLDVELSVLTAAGLLEPNAEWTENAKGFMQEAIKSSLAERNTAFATYTLTSKDPASVELQLEKLHEAVGYSVLVHHLGAVKLPNKNGQFDWTLGPQATLLKQHSDADYALFVFVRDSYASAGRVAMQVGAALLGVGLAGGTQVGFASLVDLSNGDIVWFNQLASSSGDLREMDKAQSTINQLLKTLPSA